MFGAKDNRRSDKFSKTKSHFDTGKYKPSSKNASRIPNPPKDGYAANRRRINRTIAEETVSILETGSYEIDNNVINISNSLKTAVNNTITYGPKAMIPNILDQTKETPKTPTIFKVVKATTVETILNCVSDESNNQIKGKVCALNFASAKNPGGGFLNGSEAQEESLARATGLYACINKSPMYQANTDDNNYCLYQEYMIYSPDVPIFRDTENDLLEKPYVVSIISVPAVNTGEALKNNVPHKVIHETMYQRMDRMLAILVYHGIECPIFGSWGCGVFGGDINSIAEDFYDLLTGKYKNQFKQVIFSVIDQNDHKVFSSYFIK